MMPRTAPSERNTVSQGDQDTSETTDQHTQTRDLNMFVRTRWTTRATDYCSKANKGSCGKHIIVKRHEQPEMKDRADHMTTQLSTCDTTNK